MAVPVSTWIVVGIISSVIPVVTVRIGITVIFVKVRPAVTVADFHAQVTVVFVTVIIIPVIVFVFTGGVGYHFTRG
jgi:hypothetical protein